MSADEKRDMIARFTAALPVLRKSIHMTQDQLAARSGVSRITVSAVERGRQEMSWGTFVSLLSVFSADSRSLPLLESFGVELSRLGGALPCGTGGEPYGQLYGSAPFSADILSKVDIGLWAIEFDIGQSPRMYVDDTMMRLVGLEGSVRPSPEKIYLAWYDRVDAEHYDEVLAAIRKMTAGEHAEVQYPWHHPDGSVYTIRCGGTRNLAYTKGVRIEGTHQNVTGMTHFQKKLGTVELSQDILAKANIGLWAFELDEGSEPRMYVDDTMLTLLGLEKPLTPEATYHAWYDHIDPAHYNEVAASVEQMRSGIHAEVQYPWHHPNGSVWTVRCGGVRNYAYTKGVRIEGTHQNVTELVHFQKKGLADMLAALSDDFLSVYFLDPYTGSFEAIATGASYDADNDRDLSAVNFYEDVAARSGSIVHPGDLPLIMKMYDRSNLIGILENDAPAEFVVRWPNADGHCVYMKNVIVPYLDDSGAKKLVIGVLDVTKERETEQDFAEQLKIVEGLSQDYDDVFLVELAKDKLRDKVILFRGVGLEEEELADISDGAGFSKALDLYSGQFVHPQDRAYFYAATRRETILSKLEKERSYYVNYRIILDGELHYVRLKFAAIKNENGRIEKFIVAFSNADDAMRQQLEQQEELRNALEAAEAANEAKSTFLFNMSHDIRTPMNAIIGFNNMALSYLDDREKVRDCLPKVGSSSKLLLTLINDVLDMARIESGKEKVELAPFFLRENANELMEMVRETTQKPLAIETDFSGIGHDYVLGDRVHLNRILTNVISNAVKYTPEDGRVSFIIREAPACCAGYRSYDFIVEDTGIGMTEEFLENIFEEFSRERSSTASGIQGTGLGMAITKRLVDLLGGTIAIESRVNEGTRVCIHLDMEAPEYEPAAEEQSAAEADLSLLKGRRVLLVDDNELNREIACDILEEYELVIETAENGEEAVALCREAGESTAEERFELILMDIQMPVLDGYGATRAIRALGTEWASRVPIVAMTANAFEEDRKNALESGMNDHLSKPIDRDELERVLTGYLITG